jgi:hypothetical protein
MTRTGRHGFLSIVQNAGQITTMASWKLLTM